MNKRVVFILILLLVINASMVYASSFNDVPNNHWAEDYINDMQRRGIITGYSDGTFKPNNSVTKMASITMIYRMLDKADLLDDDKIEEFVKEESRTLDRYRVPTWAKQAIAFALEEEIITESELATFVDKNYNQTDANKGEVSVYLGKALVKALDKKLGNQIYSFDFNDEFSITFAMAPYIDLLIENGIVSGDEKGNFNTTKKISRSVIAKMLSVSNELISKDGEAFYEDSIEDRVDKKVSGEITLLNDDNDTIVIKDKDDDQEMYKMIKDVVVLVNEREERLRDLDEEDNVMLFLDDNKRVIKIEKNAIETYETGTFYNIIGSKDVYLITLKNEDRDKHTFESVDRSDVEFKVNGSDADYDELEKGASIERLVLNSKNEIEELWLGSDPDVYEGILIRGLYYKDKPMIKIRTYGGDEIELEVDDDADVEKNKRDRSLKYLTKGDIVTAELDDGVVDKIVATSIEESNEGRIKKIIIAETSQLVIEDNGIEITYDIDDNVDIEIDNKDKDIYDLRLNYKVELDIEGNVIKDIEAESVSDSVSIKGFIKEIYKDNDVIVVDSDDSDEVISIFCDDAKIYDDDGDRIGFSKLDDDDQVLIFGTDDSKLFDYTAERIYIMKD